MSNFENYDFILPDGVVIENEKARLGAGCERGP